jgi:hypothetical protein
MTDVQNTIDLCSRVFLIWIIEEENNPNMEYKDKDKEFLEESFIPNNNFTIPLKALGTFFTTIVICRPPFSRVTITFLLILLLFLLKLTTKLPVGIILAIFLDQILLNIHQMSFLRFSL